MRSRQLADTVTLSDSLTRTFDRPLADSLVLADSFARLAAFTLTPADAVELSDLLAPGRALTFADLVALSDAQSIFSGIIVTLLDPIYTGHIGYGTNGDNGTGDRPEISDTVGGVVEEEVTV